MINLEQWLIYNILKKCNEVVPEGEDNADFIFKKLGNTMKLQRIKEILGQRAAYREKTKINELEKIANALGMSYQELTKPISVH